MGAWSSIFEIWQALHDTGRAEEHQNRRNSTLTIVFKMQSPAHKLAVCPETRTDAFDYCLFLMFPISRYIVLAQ
jgi:hypothetical protein